ncbi:hypothetical protein SLS57_000036 [Botryosphaeria dothidea]
MISALLSQGIQPEKITIITPCLAQWNMYREALNRLQVALHASGQSTHNLRSIRVATVDSFQGKKKIGQEILDLVTTSKVGCPKEANRLNVAFTRNKHDLIVICDAQTLPTSNYETWRRSFLAKLFSAFKDRKAIRHCELSPQMKDVLENAMPRAGVASPDENSDEGFDSIEFDPDHPFDEDAAMIPVPSGMNDSTESDDYALDQEADVTAAEQSDNTPPEHTTEQGYSKWSVSVVNGAQGGSTVQQDNWEKVVDCSQAGWRTSRQTTRQRLVDGDSAVRHRHK